jgi:hypothetical protein
MDLLKRRGAAAANRATAPIPTMAAIVAVASLLAGCGGGARSIPALAGASGRIDPIYDFMVTYPDTEILIDGRPHRGLEIDLAVRFADATVRDTDPIVSADARVVEVTAGGVAQPFQPADPIAFEGTIAGDVLATGLFGPIQVGNATLILDLTGAIDPGRRRIAGAAALYGLDDRGMFTAIKRRRYLIAATDLNVIGKAAVVDVRYESRFSVENDLETISSDPIARVEDGRPFIVNAYTFDNLQALDPAAAFITAFQYTTGALSNPHDVAVLPGPEAAGRSGSAAGSPCGYAFVPRYEPPFNDVAVIDLADGLIVAAIDLSPYARNDDHLPRPDQALLHDGLLYVTLQDINRNFTDYRTGRVVVIDPEARAVVGVVDLQGQNPFQSLAAIPETGRIYVGLAGIFPGLLKQALTGGVEAVDPVTRTSTVVVDDDLLGGNVASVAIHSATRGFCVVTDATYRNFLKVFDPSTGGVLGAIHETTNQIAALEADGDGWLIVAEAGYYEPRLLLFDAVSGRGIASLPMMLPPFSIAVLTRSL